MNQHCANVHAKDEIQRLMSSVAEALVDEGDKVRVTLVPDSEDRITVVLRVSSTDLGKIIGKQGRTARSLRTLLQAVSMKHQRHISLDIEAA